MANIGNILGKYWTMKSRVVMLKKLKLNIMSLNLRCVDASLRKNNLLLTPECTILDPPTISLI